MSDQCNNVRKEVEKALEKDKGIFLNEPTEKSKEILIVVMYNQTLLNIKSIVEKQWHVLQVNSE